jgi:DNA-binding transcriptional regulator YiaG
MEKEIYDVEGIQIEVEKPGRGDTDAERRKMAYAFKVIREQSGMNRKDFSAWLGVPYRTMQEWELGRRMMPEYVLRLIAYKVLNEKQKGRIGNDD